MSKEDFTITIKTGVEFFTAIYKRQYKLTIQPFGKKTVAKLSFCEFVPSGYRDGNENASGVLFENKVIDLDKINNLNQWIAKQVLNTTDPTLFHCGCPQRNKSIEIIQIRLGEIAN